MITAKTNRVQRNVLCGKVSTVSKRKIGPPTTGERGWWGTVGQIMPLTGPLAGPKKLGRGQASMPKDCHGNI